MSRHPTRLPILETERLRLAPVTADDAVGLYPLLQDREVMAWSDWPEVDEPDLVALIVAAQAAANNEGSAAHWSLHALADDRFIGCCDLSSIDRLHHRAEVGFLLARDTWGQGLGLEAMRAVVAHAAASGLRKLTARTHLGNRRSARLLERLGFEQEGLLRGHVLREGERRDCLIFGLLL